MGENTRRSSNHQCFAYLDHFKFIFYIPCKFFFGLDLIFAQSSEMASISTAVEKDITRIERIGKLALHFNLLLFGLRKENSKIGLQR